MNSHSRGQSINIMKKQLGEAYAFTQNEDITDIEINSREGDVHVDGVEGRTFTGIYLPASKRKSFLSAAASYHGTTIDKDNPTLSMSLPAELGYCRLEGEVWPLVSREGGPSITLRKPSTKVFPITDYASDEQIELIERAIKNRKNILIAGSTSSGKTSLLKSILYLYDDICPKERMITIEDTEELVPVLQNTESLFTKPQIKASNGDPMDMRFMVKKSLRKNPDRLIIGEIRDSAAFSVIDGWDSDHDGGVCSFHASGAENGFHRFMELANMDISNANDVRKAAMNINYVFYIDKNLQGERKIEEIVKVSFDRKNYQPVFEEVTFSS
jgi:type IV secretion system protein VirB11